MLESDEKLLARFQENPIKVCSEYGMELNDEDLDYIADKVSLIPEHKRGLLDIFKSAVYKKPSLIIDVMKVFAGV